MNSDFNFDVEEKNISSNKRFYNNRNMTDNVEVNLPKIQMYSSPIGTSNMNQTDDYFEELDSDIFYIRRGGSEKNSPLLKKIPCSDYETFETAQAKVDEEVFPQAKKGALSLDQFIDMNVDVSFDLKQLSDIYSILANHLSPSALYRMVNSSQLKSLLHNRNSPIAETIISFRRRESPYAIVKQRNMKANETNFFKEIEHASANQKSMNVERNEAGEVSLPALTSELLPSICLLRAALFQKQTARPSAECDGMENASSMRQPYSAGQFLRLQEDQNHPPNAQSHHFLNYSALDLSSSTFDYNLISPHEVNSNERSSLPFDIYSQGYYKNEEAIASDAFSSVDTDSSKMDEESDDEVEHFAPN
ncbi:uncharacterized protein MONOS_1806 [Monocercomonoides exilis]|uniref:uncharacterized protein n=1 Tax=Monocercomonoides exilis TaxID=2049356 RepID=UPI00355A0C03|nr:hypothetical protein MONOS_1806 [Monocercomonoides exilis]|eukprot:MONOS_1806.1-p1 / transcript=MONOS_1806.1 / gene=MONOS_1806 / organism=Monocercomonoides_exilis_PA203 / gene_product=unspecified product / transcript_product=unspecified product / location=Mono_scaffold00034:42291-43442(+) / protein_length=362 / sequence_SO=supercontig / SO=protein_coding / is_pseudo=false